MLPLKTSPHLTLPELDLPNVWKQANVVVQCSRKDLVLATFEDWKRALDQGYCVDVIYLDYSKAFDSVPHRRLLSKLKAYGICGNLHLWLSNFLSNFVQRVLVNGCSSDWVGVQSGVPQGSVLGQLLFILYVNTRPNFAQYENVR